MIERLLPAGAAGVETRRELLDVGLFPEEERALGRAVAKRRREFTTGRACARQALRTLGVSARPIASGPRGEPLWPPGIVGSITHCRGYTACAVARQTDLLALGIDAEPAVQLPTGVLASIARGNEREQVRDMGVAHADRLLFSAKEAAYKAWSTLSAQPPSFAEVRVSFAPEGAEFVAALPASTAPRVGVGPTELGGRWSICDGIILTVVAVSARARRSGPQVAEALAR